MVEGIRFLTDVGHITDEKRQDSSCCRHPRLSML